MDPADPHDLRIAAEEPILDTKQIAISGQHDPGDARLVEETLLKVNGVKGVTVSAAEGVAEVIFDTRETDVPALQDALLRAGHHPAPQPDPGF